MAGARGGGVWGRAVGFRTPREGGYSGMGAGGSSRDIREGRAVEPHGMQQVKIRRQVDGYTDLIVVCV